LFFAVGDGASWQGKHFLNDCSPAATSCACVLDVKATIITAIASPDFITLLSLRRLNAGSQVNARQPGPVSSSLAGSVGFALHLGTLHSGSFDG
jgi:hypothetical protein